MRLADFILSNIEPILAEWEVFARSIVPGAKMDKLALRDHAADILRATVRDMKSHQTAAQQSDKSKGDGDEGADSDRLDAASDIHAIGRVGSGFDLLQVVAEYRALRASVIRLWRESAPDPDLSDLDDLTRFNESIDQSLTTAVDSYTRRVDQSRQMFLAILGHDLRNPLNAMMMSAQLLCRAAPGRVDTSSVASGISTSAAAMARMVSDLLDFTSAGLGAAMPLSPARMDLRTLCEEVVGEMRAAHPKRVLRFQPHGELVGNWDVSRLRQLVSNLLGNAVQHGSDAGAVELSVTAEGPGIQLSVRNEGAPIPVDALPTIFDPLVRGVSPESQRKRRPGSIGLGLYIAREIARSHGGRIDVASTAADGTTFTLHLPRHHLRLDGTPGQPILDEGQIQEMES